MFSVVEMKFKSTGYRNLVQRCIGISFFLVDMNAIHCDGQFVKKKNGIIYPHHQKTAKRSSFLSPKKKKNVDLGAQGTVNRQ